MKRAGYGLTGGNRSGKSGNGDVRRGRAAAVLALVLPLLALPGAAAAQSQVGSTIGTFLRIEPSARGAAMGNAGSALADGIDAAYYNVATVGLLDRSAVQYSHNEWFAGISHDYAALALPMGGLGNFCLSLTALGSGEIDVRTVEQPLGTGERYTVSNVALGLAYGRRITSRFAAGIQFNYVTERIWTVSYKTMTINLGTIYKLSEGGAQLGFSLANLGTRSRYTGRGLSITYDNNPDAYGDNSSLPAEQATDLFPLPGLFRLGLSIPWRTGAESRMLFVFEGLHPNDNSESMNLGVEWNMRELLALRGGYQTLFQKDGELGLTLGFGIAGDVSGNRCEVSYAWAEHEHLGDTHRITVVIAF